MRHTLRRGAKTPLDQLSAMNRALLMFGADPNTYIGKNIRLLELYKAVPSLLRAFSVSFPILSFHDSPFDQHCYVLCPLILWLIFLFLFKLVLTTITIYSLSWPILIRNGRLQLAESQPIFSLDVGEDKRFYLGFYKSAVTICSTRVVSRVARFPLYGGKYHGEVSRV